MDEHIATTSYVPYHPWRSSATDNPNQQHRLNKSIIIGSNWSRSLGMTSALSNRKELLLSSPPTLTAASESSSQSSISPGQHRLGIYPDGASAMSESRSELSTEMLFPATVENSPSTGSSSKSTFYNDSMSIGASSLIGTEKVTSQHEESRGDTFSETTLIHRNTTHIDTTKSATIGDWTIPKWKELENKRLALCQKRVHLERRLFEFSATKLGAEGQFQFEQLPVLKVGNKEGDKCFLSNSSCTDSQSSDDSSHGSTSNSNIIKVTPSSTRTFKLRRYKLRKNQDPVLWSGAVNRKNIPEGEGRMVFSDGQVYEGSVRAGARQGKGVNIWPNGQIYTGSWNNNSRSGRGTHSWPDGRTVTGPWLNGHLHGRVFFRWPDGATYDGDCVKGQKEGRGIHTWKDGRVYNGQYKNGSENGLGTLTEPNQHTKYRGNFLDGKRHGYGIQIWKTKSYDGQWYQNMIHGQGKLTWLSGACYTGEFKNGRYNGIGCYVSESGTKYVGKWKDGYKHGQGKQTWADGRIYQGNFVQNKRHGYGRMVYPDGTTYAGGWESGNRVGCGIEVIPLLNDTNGKVRQEVRHCGLWAHDEAIIDKKKLVLDTSMDDSQIMLSSYGLDKIERKRVGIDFLMI